MSKKMTGKDLLAMGYSEGRQIGLAMQLANVDLRDRPYVEVEYNLTALLKSPDTFLNHPTYSRLASMIMSLRAAEVPDRGEPAPMAKWGEDIDPAAVAQLELARHMPCTAGVALMPDAHVGYAIPIGGVLATHDAVVPYAVGVDIACRLKLTLTDLPINQLDDQSKAARLAKAIEEGTVFGLGGEHDNPQHHEVMDQDWGVTKVTASLKDKAHKQLGTSGTGNHFVEWGAVTLHEACLGVPAGEYLALLSHSGSRGPGGRVCDHYFRLAMRLLPQKLVDKFDRLAWLPMDKQEGQDYWAAMTLMGDYAKANHEIIHRNVLRNAGAKPIADIDHHHNFCWYEDGLYVHRKGATPAGKGVVGIIPGSMATPGFITRGKGVPESFNSSSHGAGRCCSRTAAKQRFTKTEWNRILAENNVTLISAGLDEMPLAYKDIHQVMAAQDDLVEILGVFMPRIVKMAEDGKAED